MLGGALFAAVGLSALAAGRVLGMPTINRSGIFEWSCAIVAPLMVVAGFVFWLRARDLGDNVRRKAEQRLVRIRLALEQKP